MHPTFFLCIFHVPCVCHTEGTSFAVILKSDIVGFRGICISGLQSSQSSLQGVTFLDTFAFDALADSLQALFVAGRQLFLPYCVP